MPPKSVPFPIALATLTISMAGCPRDPAGVDDGSSSGAAPTSSGSDDPVTPPGLDGSTGSPSAETSSGTSSGTSAGSSSEGTTTTTGPAPSGRGRFIVRQERQGLEGVYELFLFEYDGELSPPEPLTPALPDGGGVTFIHVPDSGAHVGLSVFDPSASGRPYFAIDLTTTPAGPAQPLVAGPVPADALVASPEWHAPRETFVFRAIDTATDATAIFSADFTDQVLMEPQLVALPGPGEQLDSDPVIHPDGTWVAYTLRAPDAPTNVALVPLDPPDPAAAIVLSDVVNPELEAQAPTFIPGRDALLYTVDTRMPSPTVEALYFVDFSGPAPAAPVRVDPPPVADTRIRRPQVAPDGHALAYWSGEELAGDIMLVDLSEATPQLPVDIDPEGPGDAFIIDYRWSPDSRWLVYRADHALPGTYDLYLVEAPGAAPGLPAVVTDGLADGGQVLSVEFDPSSSWLYYVAQIHDTPEMFRVAISGDEPGPPQRVSAPLAEGALSGEIIPSPDWSTLLYTATDGAPFQQELFAVDVSGPEPGEARRINAPLAPESNVRFGANFSRDGSFVLYAESGATNQDPTPLRLVDLLSEEIIAVSDDALAGIPVAD